MVVLGALAATGCPLVEQVGPFAINEVAPHRTVDARPADWLELCNRGDRDRPLKEWTVRAVVGGAETTLHTFGSGDTLRAHAHAVVGPAGMGADMLWSADLPEGPAPVILRLYNDQDTLVNTFEYTPAPGGGVVFQRHCDCKEESGVDTVASDQASPGQGLATACVAPDLVVDAGVADAGVLPQCRASGCHAWFPLTQTGRQLRYQPPSGASTGTQTAQTGGAGSAPNTYMLTTTATLDGATTTTQTTYQCAGDVLAQVAVSVDTSTVSSQVTFTPPLLVLPATVNVGATSQDTAQAHVVAQTPLGPVDRTVDVTQTLSVTATEAVQTGSGTVQALRVTRQITMDGTPQQADDWYVEGVGPVKQVVPPLPGSPAPAQTWVLQDCP